MLPAEIKTIVVGKLEEAFWNNEKKEMRLDLPDGCNPSEWTRVFSLVDLSGHINPAYIPALHKSERAAKAGEKTPKEIFYEMLLRKAGRGDLYVLTAIGGDLESARVIPLADAKEDLGKIERQLAWAEAKGVITRPDDSAEMEPAKIRWGINEDAWRKDDPIELPPAKDVSSAIGQPVGMFIVEAAREQGGHTQIECTEVETWNKCLMRLEDDKSFPGLSALYARDCIGKVVPMIVEAKRGTDAPSRARIIPDRLLFERTSNLRRIRSLAMTFEELRKESRQADIEAIKNKGIVAYSDMFRKRVQALFREPLFQERIQETKDHLAKDGSIIAEKALIAIGKMMNGEDVTDEEISRGFKVLVLNWAHASKYEEHSITAEREYLENRSLGTKELAAVSIQKEAISNALGENYVDRDNRWVMEGGSPFRRATPRKPADEELRKLREEVGECISRVYSTMLDQRFTGILSSLSAFDKARELDDIRSSLKEGIREGRYGTRMSRNGVSMELVPATIRCHERRTRGGMVFVKGHMRDAWMSKDGVKRYMAALRSLSKELGIKTEKGLQPSGETAARMLDAILDKTSKDGVNPGKVLSRVSKKQHGKRKTAGKELENQEK